MPTIPAIPCSLLPSGPLPPRLVFCDEDSSTQGSGSTAAAIERRGPQLSSAPRARAAPHRRPRLGHGHEPAGPARHGPRTRGQRSWRSPPAFATPPPSSGPGPVASPPRSSPATPMPTAATATRRWPSGCSGRVLGSSSWPATWSCSAVPSWSGSRGGHQRPPLAAALLPGLRAIDQALAYGVKVFGVTVHFVDAGVDTGPVILQRAVELPDAATPEEVLAACVRSSTPCCPRRSRSWPPAESAPTSKILAAWCSIAGPLQIRSEGGLLE